MSWLLVLVIAFLGLSLSAYYSGAETGLYCLSRLRLHLGAQERNPQAQRLARILKDEPGALTVTLLGTNTMNFITTTAVAYLFTSLTRLPEWQTEVYTVALVTPVVFVFGEVVPKMIVQRHPDALMMRGSWLMSLSSRLFRATGAVWCLATTSSLLTRLASRGHPSRRTVIAPKQRVAAFLRDALAGDTLGDAQSSLIASVVRISETPLHVAMIPRNRVVSIPAKSDRRALTRVARRTRHALLPVVEPNRRFVVGFARIDHLLIQTGWNTVDEHLEPALHLKPHDTVSNAITRMQEERTQMAVVDGRGGQMIGMVVLRDLLREVVGELAAPD